MHEAGLAALRPRVLPPKWQCLFWSVIALAAATTLGCRAAPGATRPLDGPTVAAAAVDRPALKPVPRALWMAAVGDIMLDRKVGKLINANGPESILAKVRRRLRAPNLTFGNLECPLSTEGPHDPHNCCFRAQPGTVSVLEDGGFDVVSLANNHSLNAGREGILQTLETLDKAQIAYCGARRERERGMEPTILGTGGLRVGFMAFTDLSFEHGSYSKFTGDGEEACAAVTSARAQCDLLFVSVHWGEEYQSMPLQSQTRTAQALLDAGADCILGHHPHTLQGIGVYRGKPILYSMGNFVFDQRQGERMESAIFELFYKEPGVWQINATPVWIPPDRLGPIYPAAERSQRIAGRLRDLSTALGTPARVENGRVVVRISPPTASAQPGVGEQPAQNSAPAPGV
jgi:hypothetical protein